MIKKVSKKAIEMLSIFVAILLCTTTLYAQNRQITGVVVDEAGAGIVGAAVVMVGNSTLGVMTDIDGAFSINLPRNASIEVSCIGYTTEVLAVGANQNNLIVTLKESVEFLEETVVIGYGVQKKSDVTGAIASVKGEELSNRSVADVSQALQGKAAGVQILNTSGAPGSSSSIQIRGYSSNSRTSPLMIVDGLKVSNINYLDPESIASMEILKDAASAAIYGIEAGNGVILITTKSGNETKDSGRIFYNYQTSSQSIARKPELLDAAEYIEFQKLKGNYSGDIFDWDGKTSTDWLDAMTERGIQNRHTVGFQGSNQSGSLYVSLSSTDNNGIVLGDKDIYKRITAQINADYKVKKWLSVSVNTSIEKSSSRSVSEGSNTSVLGSMIQFDPTVPFTYSDNNLPARIQAVLSQGYELPRDPNGNIYGISSTGSTIWHPALGRDRSDSDSNGFNLRGTGSLNFTPIKGFTFTSRFGFRSGYSNRHTYNHELWVDSKQNQKFSISGTSSNNFYYQWENFANYLFNLGKNNFTVMAGMSFQKSTSDSVNGSADKLSDYSENFRYLANAINTTAMSLGGSPGESANLSYYGRFGWTFDNKYNIQANFRADAYDTSKLDRNHRWGYFPSVSAGWTLSNEGFLKSALDKASVSFLRLRASWGVNGNVNALGSYQYASTLRTSVGSGYDFHYDQMTEGVAPSTTLPNPEIKWETSRQVDVGLDARFFRNKLTLGLDWYTKNTTDFLTSTTAPGHTGASTLYMNAGKINNTGVELELSWKDNIGDFSYSVSGNMATLKNRVVERVTQERMAGARVGTGAGSPTVTYFDEGYPIWYLATYEVEGIDQQTGAGIYKDQNGDGVLNQDDMRYVGSAIPDLTYGLTLNFAYKGFDLSIFGTGVQGVTKLYSVYDRGDIPEANQLKMFLDKAWQNPQSTGYTFPKPNITDKQFTVSDFLVYDASFFKIKQVQLGYNLPKSILKHLKASQFRAYVSLDDWFTFTDYIGLDPETNGGGNSMAIDSGNYPISKKVVFGVNLAF